MKPIKIIFSLLVLNLAFVNVSKATNYYWRATALNNLFTNVGNWETAPGNGVSPATAPSSTDDVFFPVISNFTSINLNGGVAQNFNLSAPVVFTFTGIGDFHGSLNANGNARFSGQIYLLGGAVKNINLDPNPATTITYFTGGTLHCNAGTINLLHNLYHDGGMNIVSNTFNSNGNDIVVNSSMEINSVNGDFSGSLIDCGYRMRIISYAANNYTLTGTRIVLRSTFENVNFITNYANHSPLRVLGSKLLSFQSLKLINNKTLYGQSGAQISVDSLIVDCNKMQVVGLNTITATNLVLLRPTSINNRSYNTYNINNVVTPVSCKGSSIIYGSSIINTLASVTNSDINFNGMNFTGVGYNASSSNNLGNNWGAGITWGSALSGKVFHWIGDAGNWENPTEWSLMGSGGVAQTAAGCVPTFADSVVFDNNSFTAVGQVVNTNGTSAVCKSISVVDTDVEGNFNGEINIAGNANFSGANAVSSITLLGSGNHTLNSGNTLVYSGTVVFRMGGTYTLASRLFSSNIWQHYSGSFVSNGFPINFLAWRSSRLNANFSTRNINIENSIIDINGSGGAITSWVDLYFSHADLNSLLANNSIIRINRAGGSALFRRDATPSLSNPIFNDLIFTATSGTASLTTNYTYDRYTFNNIVFNSNARSNSVQEPYNVDTLHLTAGKNYSFTSNYTYNINHINTLSNACDELAVVSSSAGTQTRFFKSVGPFNGNNLMINNVNANGAALNVVGGVDNGGLTNVVVVPAAGRDLYWVGDAGNWNDGTHWSIGISGGNPVVTNPSGCIPRPIDNVFFDTNSFTLTGQTVNLNTDGNCKDIIWDTDAGSFNPIFTGGTAVNLNVYGSMEISPGVSHNHTGATYLRGTDTLAFSNTVHTNGVLFRSTLRPAGGGRYDFTSNFIQTGNVGLYPVSPGGFVVTNGHRMRFGTMIYGGIAASIGLSNVNKLDVRNSTIELSRIYGGGTTAYINNIIKNVTFFSNDSTVFRLNSFASWANSHIRFYSSTADTVEIGEVIFGPPARGVLLTTNFFKFKKVQFTQDNSAINGGGTIITDTLILGQSTTNTVQSGKTIRVMDSLIAFGTPCVPLTLRSSSVGAPFTLISEPCNMNLEFASLRDVTASLSTGCLPSQYNVIGNDLGGNTNWTFASIASLTQLGSDTAVYCTDSPYTIRTDGFGNVPATYLWNTGETTPSIQVDTAGTYSVNVNYAPGCNIIDSVNITIIDTVAPTIICPLDTTIYLNAGCSYALANFTDSIAVDDCTPDSAIILTQVPAIGTLFSGESVSTVWLYAEDNNGNIDSCFFQLTVVDTLNPVVVCKDTTIYLPLSGQYTIDTGYVFANASDNCGIDSVWTNDTLYDCSMIGLNTATVYVRDVNGNLDSCTANVIVVDTLRPVMVNNDTVIYLDASGNITIDTSYLFVSGSDNCAVDSVWTNDTLYDCSSVGLNSATIYITDVNGNIDSNVSNVTVIDTVNPLPACKDTTIYLNASGSFTIDSSYIENGSTDACGISTIRLSQTVYTCAEVGVNPITMYVTDVNGNIDSCTANVTVMDTINPSPVCKDTTIYLNAAGSFTIDSSYIENGSTDACGISTITLSQTGYTCAEVGVNPITLYVTDVNGNIDSCSANVTVVDTINPLPACKDTTIYLSVAGTYTIDSSYIENGSTDACGIATITVSQTGYACTEVGINPITMYVTDMNGNIDSCTANITVMDTINPSPVCKDTTIYLDATGSYTIDSSYIENGSTDACGTATITLSQTAYTCAEVGVNPITMYVTDVNGNIDSCTANVTVMDTINPSPVCKDTTIYLNALGTYTIDSSYIENGSTDACGISNITLSQTAYSCAEVGVNPITMYVTDVNGNIDSCQANVIVFDTLNPTVVCNDTIIYLSPAGSYIIDTSYVFNNANDNCGIDSVWIINSSFACADTGLNIVKLYVRDVNGNTDSCSANVTVLDTVPPMISCKDTAIYLNGLGQFTIDTSYIYSASFAGCGLDSIWTNDVFYDCSSIGLNTATVYARDVNGNVDSCQANVTVFDTINPAVVCSDTTIYLDAIGQFIIDTSFVFTNGNDNCGIDSIWTNDTLYNCNTIGLNVATVYVRDVNGNIDSCIANVAVLDTINPTVVCNDTIIYLDGTGQLIIDTSFVFTSANDNCGVDSVWITNSSFSCSDTGLNVVNVYTRDVNGNTDSCQANVTVMDTTVPQIICANPTVYLNSIGQAIVDTSIVLTSISDNCSLDSVWLSNSIFTCLDSGLNLISVYATDVNGNSDSCQSSITILDTIAPVVVCNDMVIYLDATGQASITVADIDGGSTDNCAIVSTTIDINNFDCSLIGVNNVTLTVTDDFGNVSICIAQVTVLDTITPTVSCGVSIFDTVSNACEYIVPDFTALSVLSDNCTDSVDMQITQLPLPGTVITVSDQFIQNVVITVSDSVGNQSVCVFDVNLTCKDEFQIPEFFSPNGDGKNDVWHIEGIQEYPNNRLKVFNRYGKIVYEKKGYANTWGGESNVDFVFKTETSDNKMISATYFYRLELEGKSNDREVYTGIVHIQK